MKNRRIRHSQGSPILYRKNSQLVSPCSSSRHEIEDRQFLGNAPSKGENMLHNMKLKFLLNNLIKKIKHLTPLHQVPLHVTEQWQLSGQNQSLQPVKKSQYTKQTLSEQLSHRFQFFRHLSLVQAILIGIICWLVTVSIVFRVKTGYQFFIVTLIFSISRILFLGTFALREKNQQDTSFSLDLLDDLASPALMSLTCALFILRDLTEIGAGTYIIEVIAVLTVIFQYKQFEINFKNIVKFAQQNRLKKQLRIIQLFILVITLAHFFGLLLYIATYLQPDQDTTWIQQHGLEKHEWYVQYIYCLYWAITTMVTVGYGDLTPQNYIEVIFVMFIQLFGTAVFGYMINVIGITLDQIKKKNQEFDNYQQTIDKLRDHYQLSRELCHKMKHDIKQKENQFKSIPLKTSEEKQFLDYIQPNLKQQFVLETNMRVIKKSIFFLTHFTVNFQNQIALKLIRIIYKPGEEIQIYDPQQQESDRSMVIINSGWVDIFIETHHNNIEIMKKVRQIKPSAALVMNVFGYSSLIMNRNIKLKAITKETAVSYVLRRKDVLQCIEKSMLDFESFNQMRQKMLMYKILQEVEAPTIKDNEFHFIPNIFLLQKKITYENQNRLFYMRSKMRTKMKLITARNYQNKTLPKIEDSRTQMQKCTHMVSVDEEFQSLTSLQTDHIEEKIYYQHSEENIFMSKMKIDQCKVFENFMKPFNLPIIAAAYERSCQRKSYRKRINTSVIGKKHAVTYLFNALKRDRNSKSSKSTKDKVHFLE